jgi:hypothetical protein
MLWLRNTDLMEPELQRGAAPAQMAPPPNLIIHNITNWDSVLQIKDDFILDPGSG